MKKDMPHSSSIVVLKNKINPVGDKTLHSKTIYRPAGTFGHETPTLACPIKLSVAKKNFQITDNAAAADFALVVISSPNTGSGYDPGDVQKGGTGYVPISLQYGPYKAVDARDPSIAGGDPHEKFTNRTYKGKSAAASNVSDLKMVLDAKLAMKGKPVIVVVNVSGR
jgi:beta-glucosidase